MRRSQARARLVKRGHVRLPTTGTHMNRLLLSTALLASVAITPARAATQVSVEDVGSILNESLALPAEDTPGSSIGFQEFFEFTLPTSETITVSMSDSA